MSDAAFRLKPPVDRMKLVIADERLAIGRAPDHLIGIARVETFLQLGNEVIFRGNTGL